ncbi:MAG: ATP-binding cassette domain-containing protein [Ilumatobacteraceae bacterium]
MTSPAIKVNDLVVEYTSSQGTIRAVNGLDLSIAEGEVYALLGENGAGKTSTVEVLEGHRSRVAGQVEILGIDPTTGGSRRRELRDQIGIVLQTSGIEPEITPREALTLFGAVYRNPYSLSDVVERVGLDDFVDQRVGSLSGGQRRRLDLAVAVIGRPRVLFLDEPTTGFDPSARRNAWELVRSLHADGTTILLTTHYLEEAEFLADRVGVISRGEMLVEGPPRELQQAHGRSVMSVEIAGAGSLSDVEASVAAVLDGISSTLAWQGTRLLITTEETTKVLERITRWALSTGADLSEWSIERPSLEQVFLELNADIDREGDDD